MRKVARAGIGEIPSLPPAACRTLQTLMTLGTDD